MIPRENEWAIRSRRVFLPNGVAPAGVVVDGQRISRVVAYDDLSPGHVRYDLGDRYLLPGLIDSHVHINEPGRTEWEGFATATRAAAAGGITTLIDMPLNSSPVTTNPDNLRLKQQAAQGQLWVDCAFHGGIVPANADHVQTLIENGVCAFKAFLCHSGIAEFPNATEADLRGVLPTLARANLPLFVHAELVEPLDAEVERLFAANPRSYDAWLASRPAAWEGQAIALLIRLCREYRCPTHIVHLSASLEARERIQEARSAGLPLTVETCPHYLYLAAEEIPDGDPKFKCAPPIRSQRHRHCLHEMLKCGEIDTLGSDHSPAPPELKRLHDGNLREAWGGVASLQLLLPVAWTAMRHECVFAALAHRPARLTGLDDRKGCIRAGYNADLVVFDDSAEFTVHRDNMHHRHRWTPYEGARLKGVVETTFLRGLKVYDRGEFCAEPHGHILKRKRPS